MELPSLSVQPNFVAVNEVGNQTINELAETFQELAEVTYEPSQSLIVVREDEQQGAGAEFWEIITIVIKTAVETGAVELTKEAMRRAKQWYEDELRKHPENKQGGLPWRERKVRMDFEAIHEPDGRVIKRQSIEITSSEYLGGSGD